MRGLSGFAISEQGDREIREIEKHREIREISEIKRNPRRSRGIGR
jgi:hypothetical protein